MHCTLHSELPYAMHYALCTVHYALHCVAAACGSASIATTPSA